MELQKKKVIKGSLYAINFGWVKAWKEFILSDSPIIPPQINNGNLVKLLAEDKEFIFGKDLLLIS